MAEDNRKEKMRQIRDEVWELKESPIYEYRKENNFYPVLGEGSHYAKIMFIGEAPGKNEAEQGKPFCGAAGRILDELLSHIGLERKDVYVTNVVKDRPPMNRDPEPEEISLYASLLREHLVALANYFVQKLLLFSRLYKHMRVKPNQWLSE